MAQEVRARGAHQVLAPVVDVARDPRWGRFEETYGEDPYLAARMGLAAVRGFQGGGTTISDQHVIATLKHMTGHGQPESGTNVGPASLGERTLRDVFFYPFEVAVKQGHARSLMPSYNEIDGIPSHSNRWMLRDVLRKEWGFDGTIVSDWQAISQLASRHRVATDAADPGTATDLIRMRIGRTADERSRLGQERRVGRIDGGNQRAHRCRCTRDACHPRSDHLR